jgi:hypothetical protein
MTTNELKKHPAVPDLYRQYADLQASGSRYDGRCPFPDDHRHGDEKPSFNVFQGSDGTWIHKCHACGRTGNVFQLIQEIEEVGFAEAKRLVEEAVEDNTDSPVNWRSRPAGSIAPCEDDHSDEFTFSEAKLQRYAEALQDLVAGCKPDCDAEQLFDFFAQRGINPQVIADSQIGFTRRNGQPTLVIPYLWKNRLTGVKYRLGLGADRTFIHEKGSKADYLIGADRPPRNGAAVCIVVEGDTDLWCVRSLGFNAVAINSATDTASFHACRRHHKWFRSVAKAQRRRCRGVSRCLP